VRVLRRGNTKRYEAALEFLRDGVLIAGRRIDRYEFEKCADEAATIDQERLPGAGSERITGGKRFTAAAAR
jgi:hypothetical protein